MASAAPGQTRSGQGRTQARCERPPLKSTQLPHDTGREAQGSISGLDLEAHRHVLHSSMARASVVPLAVLVEAVNLGAVASLCSTVTHDRAPGAGAGCQGQAELLLSFARQLRVRWLARVSDRQERDVPSSFPPFSRCVPAWLHSALSCFAVFEITVTATLRVRFLIALAGQLLKMTRRGL